MSFYKKSYDSFVDGLCEEDLGCYMEDKGIECESDALWAMYQEYEISYYEARGDIQ